MPPTRRSLHPSDAPSSSSLSHDRPSARASAASGKKPTASRAVKAASPIASPSVMIPSSCTPDYVAFNGEVAQQGVTSGSSKGKGKAKGGSTTVVYTEEDKDRLLQEILGFHPRTMLENIAEVSRKQIYETVSRMETHLNLFVGISGGGTEVEEEEGREIEIGLHKLETLLESHMDDALDKFIGWALRNTFNVPDGKKFTLPWQADLDFKRGQHVQTLPEGDDTVLKRIESLRSEFEDLRKVEYKLRVANAKADRELKVAERRQKEIAFVRDHQEYPHIAGIALPEAAKQIKSSLLALHSKLETVELPVPLRDPIVPALSGGGVDDAVGGGLMSTSTSTAAAAAEGTKEWEMGRAAYLNWATKRVLQTAGRGGGGGGGGQSGSDELVAGVGIDEREEKRLLDALIEETDKVGGDVDGMTLLSAGLR